MVEDYNFDRLLYDHYFAVKNQIVQQLDRIRSGKIKLSDGGEYENRLASKLTEINAIIAEEERWLQKKKAVPKDRP